MKAILPGLALLTAQEARLLALILGLLLLGLSVRYAHLRAEHPGPAPAGSPPAERTATP